MPSEWNKFVKDNYHLVAHLPNKQRLKALSEMRNGGVAVAPKRGRKGSVKGGDILGDVYNKVKKFSGGAKSIADTIDSGVDRAYKGARTLETGISDIGNRISRGINDLGNELTGSLIEAII